MLKLNLQIKSTGANPRNRLETQDAAISETLMTVLQDRVSRGQPHPELLQCSFYPLSTQASPPASHWLSAMELTIFPRRSLGFITFPLDFPTHVS